MSEGPGFWQESRRTWERLARWCWDVQPRDVGDRALQALTDIGALRRLLDQVEFEAIRAGRRHGKSWAEIAVRLGITRQSAWERWQDVDKPERPQPARGPLPTWDVPPPEQVELASEDIVAAAKRRRRSTVLVPNVIGRSWDDAQKVLRQAGLVGVSADPDGPPLGWPDGVVTDQSPESGATVPPGSAVTLWVDRGGGSGVREPLRPKPDPKTGRKMLDEAADEAVG